MYYKKEVLISMTRVVTFAPRNHDTVEDWANHFVEMYRPQEPVKMFVNLENFNTFDINKMIALKCLIDMYRPHARLYLQETTVKVGDPLLKTFIQGCLTFFNPEKPVKII